MKSSSSSEALSGSVPIRPGNLGDDQPQRSLFSLLLEIETRLRAEARRDSSRSRRPDNAKIVSIRDQEPLGILNSSERFKLDLL